MGNGFFDENHPIDNSLLNYQTYFLILIENEKRIFNLRTKQEGLHNGQGTH